MDYLNNKKTKDFLGKVNQSNVSYLWASKQTMTIL